MTYNDLISRLNSLKDELNSRPNNRAITTIISRYTQLIDECLSFGFSRKDIYEIIFSDDDKNRIKLSYFTNNLLYRARLKAKKYNNNQINLPVNNDIIPKKTTTQQKTDKYDPFAKYLSESNKEEMHDAASNMQAANARIEKLLKERGIKDD